MRERQEIEPASSTPTPRTFRNAPSEMACPYAAVFRLSSPLVAHSAHAWPFAVATATQFRRFKRSRLAGIGAPSPSSGSDHSTATEEPAQSVTLPPTSPHASCGAETHLFFSHLAIDASDTSASRTWGPCRPASPIAPSEASCEGRNELEECLDNDGRSVASTVCVTKRHKTSRFGLFC